MVLDNEKTNGIERHVAPVYFSREYELFQRFINKIQNISI